MKPAHALLAAVALVALAACSPSAADEESSPSPAPTVSAAPVPAAAATPAPLPTAVVTPAPLESAAPGGTPVPTPVPSPTPTPTPVLLPANAPPQILSYSLSSSVVHVGDTVSGTVLTTSNVASVEASIATFVIPLTKTGVGHFALSYVVPNIPKPFRHTYALRIIAHNTAGATATQSTSLTIK